MNRATSVLDFETADREVLADPARIAALARSGLLDSPPEETFDRLTRISTRALRVPVAMLTLITAERQFVKSEHGLGEPWRTTREMPLGHSVCRHVVVSGRPLVRDDVRDDPLLRSHPAVDAPAIAAYAGVPISDPDGHRLGTLCAHSPEPRPWGTDEVQLLTELAGLVEAELRARSARDAADDQAATLAEAQALAHVGSWAWDPETDALTLSGELRRLLGLGRRIPRRGPFERLLSAETRADFCERVRVALRPNGRWQAEHSIVLGNGAPRLMRSRGLARVDGNGALRLLAGTLQDITDERDHDARFAAAFWSAPIGSALVGLVGGHRGRWLQANHELERIIGAGAGALEDVSVELGVHPDDLDRTMLELDRLARGETARAQHEQRLRRSDGSWASVIATYSAIRPAGGEPGYAIGHYLDISDRRRAERELEDTVLHDPLTGVFNRRRVEEELERTLSRAARSTACGCLLVVDLDRLTTVNEVAGATTGDDLLIHVAHAIGATLRAGDTFGRLDGDEFAVLLPDADLAQGRRVAERILRIIARTSLAGAGPAGVGVTASIGLAPWGRGGGVSASQLLVAAGTAMYEAKAGGGDQYAVYGTPEEGLGGF